MNLPLVVALTTVIQETLSMPTGVDSVPRHLHSPKILYRRQPCHGTFRKFEERTDSRRNTR